MGEGEEPESQSSRNSRNDMLVAYRLDPIEVYGNCIEGLKLFFVSLLWQRPCKQNVRDICFMELVKPTLGQPLSIRNQAL